jgi:hypothetical protein
MRFASEKFEIWHMQRIFKTSFVATTRVSSASRLHRVRPSANQQTTATTSEQGKQGRLAKSDRNNLLERGRRRPAERSNNNAQKVSTVKQRIETSDNHAKQSAPSNDTQVKGRAEQAAHRCSSM